MDAFVGALKSKTIWMAIAGILVSALVPPVQDWIAAHPGMAGTLVSTIFGMLRVFTTTSLADKA